MCCSISWNSSGGNKLYPLGPNINSPIQVSTICQVEEGASSNGGRCSSVCVATSFLSDCFSTRLGRTPVLTWGVGRVFVADPRLGIWSGQVTGYRLTGYSYRFVLVLDVSVGKPKQETVSLILPLTARNCARLCDLLAVRPFPQIAQKTLSFLHSTEREKITKMMIIFKTPAILVCFMRHDPIKPQTFVQRLAHTRKFTTCCCLDLYETVTCCQLLVHAQFQIM